MTIAKPTIYSPLKPKEQEALALTSQGKTLPEISAELFLSVKTIQYLVGSARNTLHARNTIHAVALAYERGIFVPAATDLNPLVALSALAQFHGYCLKPTP